MNAYYVVRAGKPLYIETPLWGDTTPCLPALTVDDHVGKDTGLVDGNGDPIMRAPRGMGFHADL